MFLLHKQLFINLIDEIVYVIDEIWLSSILFYILAHLSTTGRIQ